MKNNPMLAQHPSIVTSVPEAAITMGGVVFNPREDRWSYREGSKSISLNFAELVGGSPYLLENLKRTLLWYARNRSPDHLSNLFARTKHFLNALHEQSGRNLAEITVADLINYRSLLSPSTRWYLGTLAVLLKKWHRLGYPGVHAECPVFLGRIRLRGNQKGSAVLTLDAKAGPFTDLELEAIQAAFNNAFAEDDISLADYMLGWLFMLLGQRPIQYAMLKVCDVIVGLSKEGANTYMVRMPRAKQGNAYPRSEFTERMLIPQIGILLARYAAGVANRYSAILADSSQAPLFPQRDAGQPTGFELHRTANSLGRKLVEILDTLEVISERTGERMHIAPTRFRRTIGTRAATEGHGELVIAELLDHTDIQNVGVYVQATPEILKRIDRAIALQMAPLAQAFAGMLIVDERDADRGNDPRSRIVGPQFTKSLAPVGSCGKHGFCGFLAPIACYTCTNFQAWADAPHEALLDKLIADRERLIGTTDPRIASINDRTILAVAQVVERCREYRITEGDHG